MDEECRRLCGEVVDDGGGDGLCEACYFAHADPQWLQEYYPWRQDEKSESDVMDDQRLLAELQENNARKELTGAERKAFAAEVGRLILKLKENSNCDQIPDWNSTWLLELADKSGMGKSSIYNWWSAFCRESGLSITPRQASDEHRNAFFAWLDAQKQAAHRGMKIAPA